MNVMHVFALNSSHCMI